MLGVATLVSTTQVGEVPGRAARPFDILSRDISLIGQPAGTLH